MGVNREGNGQLDAQIRDFDPALPIESALRPPASWYTEPTFYRLERDTVFHRNWLIAARSDQLKIPGDFVSGQVASEPYVVVVGDDGELRAFYNVCRHNAAAVCIGEGNATELVCPYHGWTYALDGCLTRAPELGDLQGDDGRQKGLAPMHVGRWSDLVFINMAEIPGPLDLQLYEFCSRLDEMEFGSFGFVEQKSYRVDCNWKVFFGNALENIGDGVAAWLYPNLVVNRHGPMLDMTRVLPRSAGQTEVVVDYYFLSEVSSNDAYITNSLAVGEAAHQDDADACRSAQKAIESRPEDRDRYASGRSGDSFRFHGFLASDYRRRPK